MNLHWYGLIVGVGIVIAMTVAERESEGKLPLWEAFWYMAVPGVVGARIYHVVDLWSYYQRNISEIPAIWQGGLAIWGGVGGVILGLLLFSYLRAKRLETRVTEEMFVLSDIFALVAPLAQSVGRLGNYVNDELWGVEAEGIIWGRHPLFVYESLLNLGLFVILLAIYRRRVRGSTFGGYLVGYGVIRIILEPLRGTEVFSLGGYPVAQIMGVTAIILGVMILRRKDKKIW